MCKSSFCNVCLNTVSNRGDRLCLLFLLYTTLGFNQLFTDMTAADDQYVAATFPERLPLAQCQCVCLMESRLSEF
jgi:hypothetical protein